MRTIPSAWHPLFQNISYDLFNSYQDAEDTVETKTNLSANSDNQVLSGLHSRMHLGVWGTSERVLYSLDWAAAVT